jgi:SWIM/SEC-C metal-binding protein
LGKRLEHFRKVLRTNEILTLFDRNVFESIVNKVIIGADSDPENPNPYKLTFVYKTGIHNSVQGKKRGRFPRKSLRNERSELCPYSEHNTCGVRGKDISGGMNIPYVELDKTSKSSIMVGGAVMAKLGDSKKPAIVRVATAERAHEIYELCESNGWKVIIGIEPDKVEDISDVLRLLGMRVENTKTIYNSQKIGRNDPCPCGSGQKYKKCCGA